MKSMLMLLLFFITGSAVFATEQPVRANRHSNRWKEKKPENFKLCEVTQSGTIGTYLTQVTITCTSKAPTCEMASLGASLCVKFQITDAYTKINATVN
ncbi:hypothetical protein [Pollutibacter soli]|uniref:hypothetical protein n=1 Tax=Pollutibacter soli TaxID=3034157 RepID=UPI0030138B18